MSLIVRNEQKPAVNYTGFSYQVAAVDALQGLEYGAIFHEQGLGKSKIAIDLIVAWLQRDVIDSAIVFTKKGLVHNWLNEIHTHSNIEPRALTQDRRANFYAFNSPARIYVAHYEVARSESDRLELFLRTRRVAAVLDEAHRIKNPKAQLTKIFHKLATGFPRRVILTGTPVANRPFDIWSPIYFLDQGMALGTSFEHFKENLDLSNDLVAGSERTKALQEALEWISEQLRAFSVRETKKSAGISLPNKEVTNVPVALAGRQAELYCAFRDELKAMVLREGRPVMDDAETLLKRLLRLVQVASNPRLVDEGYVGMPAKFPVLEKLIASATAQGERIIVWSSFTENVDWLARQLQKYGVARVHGKLSIEARLASIDRFQCDSGTFVLVATPAAAKEGLTLTVANHAVFYDRSFSLDDYLQAQDRIHRISQTRTCFVTNLIAEDTVDEWVDVLLSAKHLAAQLGQGDLSGADYERTATYEFGAMLRHVLGVEKDGGQ